MGNGPLGKSGGVPRVDAENSHHFGNITWEPDAMVVDGVAPSAVVTKGTNNQALYDVMRFASAADDICFMTDVLKQDYHGSKVKIRITVECTVNVGTMKLEGTIRTFTPDGTNASDAAGTAWDPSTATTVPGTADQPTQIELDISSNAGLSGAKPGDRIQLLMFRDVSDDTAAGNVDVLKVEVIHDRQ